MKTHYELLGVDPSAAPDTIKKAFRHEIARYHPDKVLHLGQEFQEMAAERAAELTVAYKTLTDPAMRAEYDARLEAPSREPAPAPPAPPPVEPVAGPKTPRPPRAERAMFETERAGRDVILRRAMAARVRNIVEGLYGAVKTPSVRGFDFALVPVARSRLLGTPSPRVLMKVIDTADASALNEAWSSAARASVHAGKSPVVALLFAKKVAPHLELQRAMEALHRQRRSPDGPAEIAVVIIDTADLTARVSPGASAAVKKLVEALRV